jgi:hypothetical protein
VKRGRTAHVRVRGRSWGKERKKPRHEWLHLEFKDSPAVTMHNGQQVFVQ